MTAEALLLEIEQLPKAERTIAALRDDAIALAAGLPELERARLRHRLKALGVSVGEWTRLVDHRRAAGQAANDEHDENDWRRNLARGDDGEIKATPRNVGLILRNWAPMASLRLNELYLEAELDGARMKEADYYRLRERLEQTWGVVPSSELIQDAVAAVAEERAYHPVRQYLDGLTWDGEKRLERVASEVLLAGDDPLYARFVTCWMVSAVARLYRPGEQVDTALVLYSQEQGRKKSTFFRVLAGDWWTGGDIDPADKDTILRAHQSWVVILDEVDALTAGYDGAKLKRWITEPLDVFRPPYGRRPARHPRRFVFGATTNKQEFLHDPTGARRWWIVAVGDVQEPQIDLLRQWRDQLWAEARTLWESGTDHGRRKADANLWWLTPDEEEDAKLRAGDHQERDPWHDRVAQWLRLQAGKGNTAPPTTAQILEGACRIWEAAAQDQKSMRRIGAIMRSLGYYSKAIEGDEGRARAWVKS